MALTNIDNLESMVQSNLAEIIQPSDTPAATEEQPTSQVTASAMFEDDDSMNFLMNRIGLEVQRNGGQ